MCVCGVGGSYMMDYNQMKALHLKALLFSPEKPDEGLLTHWLYL